MLLLIAIQAHPPRAFSVKLAALYQVPQVRLAVSSAVFLAEVTDETPIVYETKPRPDSGVPAGLARSPSRRLARQWMQLDHAVERIELRVLVDKRRVEPLRRCRHERIREGNLVRRLELRRLTAQRVI
jgi:hypothetical protein